MVSSILLAEEGTSLRLAGSPGEGRKRGMGPDGGVWKTKREA
jgi:hypothetical protein